MSPVARPIYSYQDYPPEYQQYNTQYPGAKESIGWIWWDSVTYLSTATTQLRLFNAVRATPDLSNMELAGQLAAPKAFFFRGLRLYIKVRPHVVAAAAATNPQTGVTDDLAQLLNTGIIVFVVGAKEYVRLPLWVLTTGGGVRSAFLGSTAAAANLQDFAQLGNGDNRDIFTLAKPLFIAPQINFYADLIWPAALTLARGNTVISIGLDGDLIRPVQ
jgi:hypothetical protein